MQIHIGQHRRNQSTLRRSPVTVLQFRSFHDSRNQKPLDIAHEVLILYIVRQKFHEPLMVYVVKEAFYIGIQHVVDLVYHDRLVDIPHHVMC